MTHSIPSSSSSSIQMTPPSLGKSIDEANKNTTSEFLILLQEYNLLPEEEPQGQPETLKEKVATDLTQTNTVETQVIPETQKTDWIANQSIKLPEENAASLVEAQGQPEASIEEEIPVKSFQSSQAPLPTHSSKLDKAASEKQLSSIQDQVIVFQNTAFNAEGNLKSFFDQINLNLEKGQQYLSNIQQLYNRAMSMKGCNLALTQDYQQTINCHAPYINTLTGVKEMLSSLKEFLFELEPQGYILLKDIESCANKYQETDSESDIKGAFKNTYSEIQALSAEIEKPSLNLSNYINNIRNTICQFTNRKNKIESYLAGPGNPHLYMKNRNEFSEEINQLTQNIAFLNKLLPLLEETHSALKLLQDQTKTLDQSFTKLGNIHCSKFLSLT